MSNTHTINSVRMKDDEAINDVLTDVDITFPSLSFEIDNVATSDTPINTIYAATQNHIQLCITTNTPKTSFDPGSGPVDPKDAHSSTGSLLYLDLSLLNLTSFGTMKFSAQGWQFQVYGQVLCMYSVESITFDPTDKIIIDIQNLSTALLPSGEGIQLGMTYYRVGNINKDNGNTFVFKVVVQNSPDGQANLYEQISLTLPSPYIVISDPNTTSTNKLTFSLQLYGQAAPVYASTDTSHITSFTLSFVYASDQDGYGALTTAFDAKNFSIIPPQDWNCTPSQGDQNPSWLFTPKTLGMEILGTAGVIDFTITNIQTTCLPGPTLLYFSYTNVPKYADGCFYGVIEKIPHVEISSPLTAIPNPVMLSGGVANVTLQWQTNYATSLSLNYDDVTSDSGSCTRKIKGVTEFTLNANGIVADNFDNKAESKITVDISYGFFLRNYLNELPPNDSNAVTNLRDSTDIIASGNSPDIIAIGANAIWDTSDTYLGEEKYNEASDENNRLCDTVANYVYVRGKNTTSAPITARVWLYLVDMDPDTDNNLPHNWISQGVLGDNGNNYIEFIDGYKIPPGVIEITGTTYSPSFVIAPYVVKPGKNYSLCAISENLPLSYPPQDPRPIQTQDYTNWEDAKDYINRCTNYAWLNTKVSSSQSIPSFFQQVTSPSGAGTPDRFEMDVSSKITAGVSSAQGKFLVNMSGPRGCGDDTIGKGEIDLLDFIQPNFSVFWPQGFSSYISANYYYVSSDDQSNPPTIKLFVEPNLETIRED